MSIIRAFFGKKVIPGEIYVFEDHSKNPFENDPLIVEVKAVSKGYVNYRWLNCKSHQNESLPESHFRFCYVRHRTPAEGDTANRAP